MMAKKAAKMQCYWEYCYWLSNKVFEEDIPENSRNAEPNMQWVQMERGFEVYNCLEGRIWQLGQGRKWSKSELLFACNGIKNWQITSFFTYPSCSKGPPEQVFPLLWLTVVYVRERLHKGAHVETFVDVRSNVSDGYEGFSPEDGNNMEIPTMYSQGLNMSSEDIKGVWLGRSSNCRTGSSRLKRKRGPSMWKLWMYVIRDAWNVRMTSWGPLRSGQS